LWHIFQTLEGCYAASTGLFGVIEASLGSSPMVIITDITTYGMPAGHGTLQCGGGEYGNFDAEGLGAPVATSTLGKGAFAEVHPLALECMGVFGSPVANKVVREADLVLIVGCRLKGPDTITESPQLIDPIRQTLIQIDVEARNAGWVFPINLGLIGDAKVVLAQLNEALADNVRKRPSYEQQPRFAQLQQDKQELHYFVDAYSRSDAVPILPQRLAKELSDSLAEDAIVCADAGNNQKPAVVDVTIDPKEPMQERLHASLGVYGSY
jgi:thiamine pyrophosphate-dependent acetolactate synthase large subunit-like protein